MRNRSCHGDPSVFSFESKTCTGCPGFDSCVGITHDSLLQMKAITSVTSLIDQHARFIQFKKEGNGHANVVTGKRELSQAEEAMAKTLPVKTASQYRRIVSEGFVPRMRDGVASGTNPFSVDGYKYLSVAFDALLAGGFTKKELRLHYMSDCGWSEGTAFSAVSMIWHLFTACGVAIDESGSLRPKKGNHNDD